MKRITTNPKCKSEDNSTKVKRINLFKDFFHFLYLFLTFLLGTCDAYS